MKDVSELLAKRLQTLAAPFSREWLTDFSGFIKFIKVNPITFEILAAIIREKKEAHASLIRHLKGLFDDGKKSGPYKGLWGSSRRINRI